MFHIKGKGDNNLRRHLASVNKKAADVGAEKKVIVSIPGDDFVIAQSSICCSVALERGGSHLILPEFNEFVNSNGDCWSNESLAANYPSFEGAFNYTDHIQVPEKSIGFIGDSVLRRRILDAKQNVYNFYVDILTLTHRDMAIAKGLLSGEIEYMSMGCEAMVSRCSKCGEEFHEEDDSCQHMDFDKGRTFFDKSGVLRVCAEILGDENPGSCEFIEASYLTEVPAFGGAVKRNLIKVPKGATLQLLMRESCASKEAVSIFTNPSNIIR